MVSGVRRVHWKQSVGFGLKNTKRLSVSSIGYSSSLLSSSSPLSWPALTDLVVTSSSSSHHRRRHIIVVIPHGAPSRSYHRRQGRRRCPRSALTTATEDFSFFPSSSSPSSQPRTSPSPYSRHRRRKSPNCRKRARVLRPGSNFD